MTDTAAPTEINLTLDLIKNARDYLELKKLRSLYYAHKDVRSSLDREVEDAELNSLTEGVVAWIQGHNLKAVELLKNEQDDASITLVAEANFLERQWKEALEATQKISQASSQKAFTTRLAVEVLIELKRLEEAEKEFQSMSPDNIYYLYCRGLIYESKSEHINAVKSYEEAFTANPKDHHALFRAARIHDRYGNDAMAIRLYEQCREVMPVIVSCLVNLGLLYEDASRYQDAVYCFEEILDIDPNHERAKLFLNDINQSFNMTYDEEAERLRDQQQKLLQTNIADFELSVRSRNCLQMMNIHTLGDLVQKSEQELLSYPNFGDTSLQEIKEILTAKKIRLGHSIKPGALAQNFEPGFEEEHQDPLLKTMINSMKFSIRSSKVLESLGVTTVGDLVQFSEEQLLAQKNFGKTSIKEINAKLSELGIQLKQAEKKERMLKPEISVIPPSLGVIPPPSLGVIAAPISGIRKTSEIIPPSEGSEIGKASDTPSPEGSDISKVSDISPSEGSEIGKTLDVPSFEGSDIRKASDVSSSEGSNT